MKITTPHLKKLDDRSQKIVCSGVAEGSVAHRLYDPLQKKIVVSRDVIFEGVKWSWGERGVRMEEFLLVEDENMGTAVDLYGQSSAGALPTQPGVDASGEQAVSVQGENTV
jgi:hypothetical protein